MASKRTKKITWGGVSEYAETREISRQHVYRILKQGDIAKRGKQVSFTDLDNALHRDSGGKKTDDTDTSSNTNRLTKARADKETTKAEIEDLKLAEMQGELLHREAIATAMQQIITSVRQQMIDMPSRLTPQIASCGGDEHEINKILTASIKEIMNNLYALRDVGDGKQTEKPDN